MITVSVRELAFFAMPAVFVAAGFAVGTERKAQMVCRASFFAAPRSAGLKSQKLPARIPKRE